MKQKIISELSEFVLKKLQDDNKREMCLKVVKDIELNMEDSEVTQLVARKKEDSIVYKYKSFFHTMREFQPREQNIVYTDAVLESFSEEDLKNILEITKKYYSF